MSWGKFIATVGLFGAYDCKMKALYYTLCLLIADRGYNF